MLTRVRRPAHRPNSPFSPFPRVNESPFPPPPPFPINGSMALYSDPVNESNLQRNLLVFGQLLRKLGIDVHTGRLVDVTEALQHVDLGSRDEVYYTCRCLLVYRHEDLPIFDRAFEAFWMGRGVPVRP